MLILTKGDWLSEMSRPPHDNSVNVLGKAVGGQLFLGGCRKKLLNQSCSGTGHLHRVIHGSGSLDKYS